MKPSSIIRHIDFELSSLCNAKCPVCPRQEFGQFSDFVQSYTTLEETQKMFDEELIKNLYNITICGNFGDGMGNPDIVKIISWFKSINSELYINIATNGGIGKPEYYEELAKLGCEITFGIDGYEEVNELYRVNVKWDKLKENVTAFSKYSGNNAFRVQFLFWEETTDQILPLIDFLEPLGCDEFWIRKPFTQSDNKVYVYDNNGKESHILTEITSGPFMELTDTRWGKDTYDELRNKLKEINSPTKSLEKWEKRYEPVVRRKIDKDYTYTEFEFTEQENQEVSKVKTQTCYSMGVLDDKLKDEYYLYVTHDGYLMPCCIIPPYISIPLKHHVGWETNRQKEILNKITEIGLDNFNVKNKSITEVFDSGVIHKFVYDNIKEDKQFQYCKMACGRC